MKRLFKFSGLRIYILVLLVLSVCIVSVLLVFKKGPQKNTDAFIEESKKDVATNTHIHEWSEWEEIKGRFCTDGSDWTRKCNSCNETEKRHEEGGEHTLVDLPPKVVTCTEGGYINHVKCLFCDYETKYELDPLGHSYEYRQCVRCKLRSIYSEGLKIEEIFGYKAKVSGRGSCKDNEVFVPPEYNGFPVTEINFVFHEDSSVKTVVLPDSITKIGSNTFCKASNLTNVEIGKKVELIGGSAFEGCTSLKKIVLPDSLTHIGGCAFMNCTNLETIVIPKSVKVIRSFAFWGCTNLKYAVIEDPESWNADVDLTDPYKAAEWLKSRDQKLK